jgi:CRP/FNR family cyclic AMP-dependent transcriptional regulator
MTTFNTQEFLDDEQIARRIVDYRHGQAVFSQGDACAHVMYLCKGAIKLSVRSTIGREAIVAILGPGEFFGEASLAGQRTRAGSATAIAASTVLLVDTHNMVRLLRRHRAMCDRFIAHMLARNAHIEKALIDQLFDSCE